MQFMTECGVKEKVIIHCKSAGFCYDVASENFTVVPSLRIPSEKIMGSVGAGDAFCAGALYGIYHDYTDQEILEYASAAAACSLFAENSVDGMLDTSEIKKLSEKHGRMKLCL